jgi:hypothetical protein
MCGIDGGKGAGMSGLANTEPVLITRVATRAAKRALNVAKVIGVHLLM